MKRRLPVLVAIISLLLIVLASTLTSQDIPPGAGDENCGKIASSCSGGSNCRELPTSLQPVDLNCWTNCCWEGSGNCGTKPWGWIFRTPCGRPLSTGICC
ncbi:MAG: hypothetical protein GY847_12140 [Proteobacteria bacterium]|nr:hypothetical protein [Pseudomonadota bacterium]